MTVVRFHPAGDAPATDVVETPAGLAVEGTSIVHLASGALLAIDVGRVEFLPVALARLAGVDWLAVGRHETAAATAAIYWAQREVDGATTVWLADREQVAGRVACSLGLCPFCLRPDHGLPGTAGCEMVEVEAAEATLGISVAAPWPSTEVATRRAGVR
jgi:hypothetical protein